VQVQRDAAQGAQVGRHILAGAAVAARRATQQDTVFIGQADRQAVELRFGDVDHVALGSESFAHAAIEGGDLVIAEGVAQRQHRRRVRHRGEAGERRRADPLRRRVAAQQLGMLGFERLQLAKQPVVLGISDQRCIEDVIAVVVLADLGAQATRPLARAHSPRRSSDRCTQENSRCASGPPAGN
jgi:hypothetical protein